MEAIINDSLLVGIPKNHLIISVVAYCLSEYDMKAVKDLGFSNKSEVYRELSAVFDKPDNGYMHRRRDEFAALPDSRSALIGLTGREPAPSVLRLAELLKPYSYQDLITMIKDAVAKKISENEEIIDETDEDAKRVLKKINSIEHPIPTGAIHKGIKKQAPSPVENNGKKYYRHSIEVSENALSYAEFKCEINPEHPTFIRRKTGQPYTEAHHLVPMSKQGGFDASLDVEENVASLCSNCHNQIHYGKESAELITVLFKKRKEELDNVGINIDLANLLKMYR